MKEKAKVLVITPQYFAFIKDSLECQSPHLNHIDVFVPYNPLLINFKNYNNMEIEPIKNYINKTIIDKTNLPVNIKIHAIPSLFYIPIEIIRKCNLYYIIDYLANQYIKYIKYNDIDFDIIHAHFTYPCGYVGTKIKKYFNKPLIITGHGYDVYSLPFRDNNIRVILQKTLNEANQIITVSSKNNEYLKKINITTSINIIPNGFRTDLFFPRDMLECRAFLHLPLDKKIILSIGNLEPVKGHLYLIQSIKKIILNYNNILCIIIGSGSLFSTIRHYIHENNLEDYIILVDRKPHEEIPFWINACDVVILPSLNEGNPTVMFEALGCGKPFIGTKVGGMPEIISSDDYGYLVNIADPIDLMNKISAALNRNWDQQKILVYAKQYSWDIIAKEILKIYNLE